MFLARRIMSIWLPRWSTDRLKRRARGPFALVTSVGSQRLVSAVNAAAADEGVAPGMTLADACALRPDLATAEADFAADAAALTRLTQWCGRWSPWTAPCPPDGIWLDVTGCAHLQGGEPALAAEVTARLAARGLEAGAAIAGTPGAAWAMARYGGGHVTVLPEGRERAALEPLPVAALRLAPEMAAALERVGLRRIGDLYPMPRPALVLRFGAGLAARLDQALGRVAEPLSPLPPLPQRWARRRFAEPILTAEAIGAATRALLDLLCRQLAAAGEGARKLDLTLYRVDGTPVTATVGTARPSHDSRHLLRLLEERYGTIDPGLGIEDMLLAAVVAEPQPAAQLALPSPSPHREEGWGEGASQPAPGPLSSSPGAVRRPLPDGERYEDDLVALVDRLVARLGEGVVGRPVLRESHWPERAVQFAPALDPVPETGPGVTDRDSNRGDQVRGVTPGKLRPVRLLPRPEPVEAVAPVPDDPPLLFRWRRVMHRVRRADGPERIAGEWWLNNKELRDYYRIEDEEGRRFWLYRAGLYRPDASARWFLHGMFA